MKSIAIITARGGSKRIPHKNIKEFLGRPIIAYSIDAAIQSNIFDEVMVSTDSEEIAQIALRYGAKVPFMRSKETSNDFATTDDVLNEVLSVYATQGKHFDIMCCIYPTAPFVTAEKLRESVKLLENSDSLALMPVVQYCFPPQRGMKICNKQLVYLYPEYMYTRSQDLEPVYHDCGQYYVHKVAEDNTFCSTQFMPYIVSELEVQDIDNEADWEIAELKYTKMRKDGVR